MTRAAEPRPVIQGPPAGNKNGRRREEGHGLTSASPGPATKAAAIVARDLSRQIVKGIWQEGDVLSSEAELISTYGVSRAVLREALRLLEWDSYLTVRRGAGGGAVVTLPDARVPARYCGLLLQVLGTTLDDLDRAIRAIEPEIVRIIAEEDHGSLEVLERALEGETDSENDRTASNFLTWGSHFHELLPSVLGNPALKVLLDIPREIRVRHNLTTLTTLTNDPIYHQKTSSAHRRALRLMKDGDGEGARELWRRHLAATSEALHKGDQTTVLDLFSGRAMDFDLAASASGGQRQTRIPKGADIVAGDLRRQIVTGAIGEGDSIPTERALMERYGLSRPVVREALRILEAEHLVQLVRGAHQGGRARQPNVHAAVWQAGLLMERLGCTVSAIAEAQWILERCASQLLTDRVTAPGPLPEGESVYEALLGAGDPHAGTPEGDLDSALDMFDALSRHVPNRTLQVLGTIGRTLLRRALETPSVADGAEGGMTASVRTQLALLRAAGNRNITQLQAAWAEGAARIYRGIADSAIAGHRIDMFR